MLYVIPTPIGNLGDITLRALEVLKQVDVIACEDTRTSGKLLSHFGITTPRISYHEHNERSRTPGLIERMKSGKNVAIISDAGTPGISDPGFYLVRECRREGIDVTVLPGASAALTALVASGLPCDRFVFEGFLPQKKGRRTRLEAVAKEDRTVVIYESPHRIVKTLAQLLEVCDECRETAVARELTKQFEEIVRGSLREVHDELSGRDRQRGEFVIVLGSGPRPA